MVAVRLTIYKSGTVSDVRCEVGKWEFNDKAMEEQYIMFTIESPVPIAFAIGDWCEFRGQRYTLNVEPTCTQKARPREYGAAFVYESVKMNSPQDDLTRCMILDIIPTSGEHSAAYGTNYTGSANFSLYCFETTFSYQGVDIYYAPVHALLDRIKANLDRLYPGDPQDPDTCWQVYIDDSKCHTDDKILTFSNWTAAQALAEVHNTFKLDYVVRGKKIIVGDVSEKYPELDDIVGYITDFTEQGKPVLFGYGMGYLSEGNEGKSLFQIKKLSKNDQQVITRLRAIGSTKNMPYRYYHNNYTLPQTMFVQNLQLPDTFVPYDRDEDYPDNVNATHCKVDGNASRDEVYGEGVLRHVLGKSNDAYIDKNDDAASCPEGIRESVARWDGSDGELPEIYPTIENATYGQLRSNDVPDMDGRKASQQQSPLYAFPGYANDERIDEILEPGEHCNEGNGVMSESEAFGMTSIKAPLIFSSETADCEDGTHTFDFFAIPTVQPPGSYILSFDLQTPEVFIRLEKKDHALPEYAVQLDVTLKVNLLATPVDGSNSDLLLGSYTENGEITRVGTAYGNSKESYAEFMMTVPEFHETEAPWAGQLNIAKESRIWAEVVIYHYIRETGEFGNEPDSEILEHFELVMGTRMSSQITGVVANAIWGPSSAALFYSATPFHLRLKDIGVDFTSINSINDDDIVISMKSGQCAGREFTVKRTGITKFTQTSTGKQGWDFELDRVNDESIYAYFPSATNQIKAGDQFVLLNIPLPDAYIKAAEARLLTAATNHLADNCDTQYTYQPSVDDIYLQRNLDAHELDPENSVFWKLYAGMRFPFYGIPADADDPLPIADITIESVVIRMGEKLTPQVEITLNDKLQQTTMQRLQTSVDRLYGSVFSHGGVPYSSSSAVNDVIVHDFGKRYFLSKIEDDTAEGEMTFKGNINAEAMIKMVNAYVAGSIGTSSFDDSFGGTGWKINAEDSSMVLDEITVRKGMRVYEMLLQKVRATGGEIIVSPSNGKAKSVSETNRSYVVELESDGDNGFGNTFNVYDYVRCQSWDASNESSHFYWAMVTASNDNVIELSKAHFGVGEAPQPGDELVLFGNYMDTSRQGAITISAAGDGKPRITVYNNISSRDLTNCTKAVLGDLNGLIDSELGTLEGYGLYSDNVYLKGKFQLASGTKIDDAEIVLQSNKTTIRNNNGEDVAMFTSDGRLIVHDIESNKLKVFSKTTKQTAQGSSGPARYMSASIGINDTSLLTYYYDNGQIMRQEYPIVQEIGFRQDGTEVSEGEQAVYTENQVVALRRDYYLRDGSFYYYEEFVGKPYVAADGLHNYGFNSGLEEHPSPPSYSYTWTYKSFVAITILATDNPYDKLQEIYMVVQDSDRTVTQLIQEARSVNMSECSTADPKDSGMIVKADLHTSNKPYSGPLLFDGIIFTSNNATVESEAESRYSRTYKIYMGGMLQSQDTIHWQE